LYDVIAPGAVPDHDPFPRVIRPPVAMFMDPELDITPAKRLTFVAVTLGDSVSVGVDLLFVMVLMDDPESDTVVGNSPLPSIIRDPNASPVIVPPLI